MYLTHAKTGKRTYLRKMLKRLKRRFVSHNAESEVPSRRVLGCKHHWKVHLVKGQFAFKVEHICRSKLKSLPPIKFWGPLKRTLPISLPRINVMSKLLFFTVLDKVFVFVLTWFCSLLAGGLQPITVFCYRAKGWEVLHLRLNDLFPMAMPLPREGNEVDAHGFLEPSFRSFGLRRASA